MKKNFLSDKAARILVFALAGAHILASFLYDSALFSAPDFTGTPIDRFGSALTYIVAKLLGALLIYLFWRTLVRALRGGFPKSGVVAFLVLFAVTFVIAVSVYPAMYEYEIDDLIVYYNATQHVPLYWHHYLTGCVYAASYMLFPHPLILPLVQCAFFCGLIASVFARLFVRLGGKRAWPALLLFAVPASYYIGLSPYRNCLFTILCLFVFSEILFLFVDGRAPDKKQLALLIPAFGVIAVWRSEGILYLLLLPITLLALGKTKWLKTLLLTGIACVVAVAVLLPQNYGMANAEDGMGKNYKLISAMNALQDIYLDENANFSYDGADADSAVIDSFVPLNLLEEYGLAGFRYYNMENGRRINYSGRSDEDIAAFMSAYQRIVLHNLSPFLRTQVSRACEALGLPAPFADSVYQGESEDIDMSDLYSASRVLWGQGRDALAETTFWTLDTATFGGKVHSLLQRAVNKLFSLYESGTAYLSVAVRVLAPLAALFFGIRASLRRKNIFPVLFVLVLLAEFAAIVLMAPEGRAAYYYPVLYGLYLFLIVVPDFRKKAALKRPDASPGRE